MSIDSAGDEGQLGPLSAMGASASLYGVESASRSTSAATLRATRQQTPVVRADSADISPQASGLAELAKHSQSQKLGGESEVSWASLQSLQDAVRTNTLPVSTVALAHAILRDENPSSDM